MNGRIRSALAKIVPRRWHDPLRVKLKFGGDPVAAKHHDEIGFWRELKATEGLWNGHYEPLYTTSFGLDRDFFAGKAILDIGCGPCGSLEWASEARLRVGLDPLADQYRELGTDEHAMSYASAPSERIPFPDAHFDVVASFNSLDHVDDLEQTVAEIIRVLRPGGTFLLITEVNHPPRVTEPHSLKWDVVDMFAPALQVVSANRYEMGKGVFTGVLEHVEWTDQGDPDRVGVLHARLQKVAEPS